MKLVEWNQKVTLGLEDIVEDHSAPIPLSKMDGKYWGCRVFNVNDGTLIYVPDVTPEQLFKGVN